LCPDARLTGTFGIGSFKCEVFQGWVKLWLPWLLWYRGKTKKHQSSSLQMQNGLLEQI
jgi:hypothetical protein